MLIDQEKKKPISVLWNHNHKDKFLKKTHECSMRSRGTIKSPTLMSTLQDHYPRD